jgi:hypothetical protein
MVVKKVKKVRFDPNIDNRIYRTRDRKKSRIDKKLERRESRKQRHDAQAINRMLRYIERYMRKNDLLLKDEYLEPQKKSQFPNYKHLRGEIINQICDDRDWKHDDIVFKIIS